MLWKEILRKKDDLGFTASRFDENTQTVVQVNQQFLEVRDVYIRPHPVTGQVVVVLDTREKV